MILILAFPFAQLTCCAGTVHNACEAWGGTAFRTRDSNCDWRSRVLSAAAPTCGHEPLMHRPLSSVLGESKVMWLSSCEGPHPKPCVAQGVTVSDRERPLPHVGHYMLTCAPSCRMFIRGHRKSQRKLVRGWEGFNVLLLFINVIKLYCLISQIPLQGL